MLERCFLSLNVLSLFSLFIWQIKSRSSLSCALIESVIQPHFLYSLSSHLSFPFCFYEKDNKTKNWMEISFSTDVIYIILIVFFQLLVFFFCESHFGKGTEMCNRKTGKLLDLTCYLTIYLDYSRLYIIVSTSSLIVYCVVDTR